MTLGFLNLLKFKEGWVIKFYEDRISLTPKVFSNLKRIHRFIGWKGLAGKVIDFVLHALLNFADDNFTVIKLWTLKACRSSSETQGRSVGRSEKARRKFSSTGGKAPGYRLSPDHFQTVKRMLTPDWGQKNALYYCVQSANSFSWVLFVSWYTTAIISSQLSCLFTKIS